MEARRIRVYERDFQYADKYPTIFHVLTFTEILSGNTTNTDVSSSYKNATGSGWWGVDFGPTNNGVVKKGRGRPRYGENRWKLRSLDVVVTRHAH